MLKDAVSQSDMWEVNNPRVMKILTLSMEMIEDDELFVTDFKNTRVVVFQG